MHVAKLFHGQILDTLRTFGRLLDPLGYAGFAEGVFAAGTIFWVHDDAQAHTAREMILDWLSFARFRSYLKVGSRLLVLL